MFAHADYVYAVYKERSFTKAAQKLYISQPSLSHTVSKLEERLGFPIFQRGGKELRLTPMGERYIATAEKILAIQHQFESEIDDLLQLCKGSITLGSTTFIASYVLPGLLKKFSERYPDIEVKLYVEQSTVLREMVEKGLVDIAIDNTLSCDPEHEYIPLFREQILVGVPKDNPINEKLKHLQLPPGAGHRLEEQPAVDVSVFSEERFILLKSGNHMRRTADNIFKEKNICPKVCYEFDQLMTAISFAKGGFGLCFLTDTILKFVEPCKELVLYRPDTAFSERKLYIIRRRNQYLSTAGQALIRFLTE